MKRGPEENLETAKSYGSDTHSVGLTTDIAAVPRTDVHVVTIDGETLVVGPDADCVSEVRRLDHELVACLVLKDGAR